MIKDVFKDSLFYTISGFLGRGISLFLVPLYTRVFSPSDYGIIDIYNVAGRITVLFVGFEITQAIARFYPETEDKKLRQEYASTALIFICLSYFIFGLIIFSFNEWFEPLIVEDKSHSKIYFIAFASIMVGGIANFLQNQIRFQFKSKVFSVVNVVTLLTTVLIAIYLVLILRIGVIGTFYAGLVGSIINVLLSYYFSKSDYKLIFSTKRLREMLLFSAPLVPSSMAVFVANFFDRIALKELLGLTELGLYGIGFRFASIVTLLITGFQMSLTPLIVKNHMKSETPGEIARLFNYFLFFAFSLIGFLYSFPKEILTILTTKEYYNAWIVVGLLSSTSIISNLYIFTPGLNIAKKTKYVFYASVIGAVLNVLLNYLLIPIFGMIGAAISTLFSALSVFIFYYYQGQRHYLIPFEKKKIGIGLALLMVSIIGVSFLNHYYEVMLMVTIIKSVVFTFVIFLFMILFVDGWKQKITNAIGVILNFKRQ